MNTASPHSRLLLVAFLIHGGLRRHTLRNGYGGVGEPALTKGLVGHWPLKGDAQDRSGQNNHEAHTGSGAEWGNFDGRQAYVEIPSSDSLNSARVTSRSVPGGRRAPIACSAMCSVSSNSQRVEG